MTNPDSIASLTSTRQAILAALAKLKDQIDPKYPNANLDAANKRQVTPPGARLNHQESPHRSPWVIPMDKITESLKIHLPEYLKRDIQDQAMAEDRSVSDWIRRVCAIHLYGIVGHRERECNGANRGEKGHP